MAANPFKITISGEDKGIIKLLQRVQVEFEGIDAPVKKTGESLKKTSQSSGLSDFNKQLGESRNAAVDMASGIERIIPPIETLVALGSAGGLADLTYKFAGLARQIELTKKYTGLSTDEIQRWTGMATAAGIAGGTMNETLNSFSQAIEGAVYGRNMDLKMFSVRMGVDLGEPGSVRGVDNVLTQIAEAISANPDPKIKTAIISAFGLDNIKAFLIDGTKGLEQYKAMVERAGLIQTPEQVAAAAAFNKTLRESWLAVEGLGNAIGGNLIPVFQPLLQDFNDFIEKNREFIAMDIKHDVIEIKDALVGLGHSLKEGVDLVGGWHNAFVGLEIYVAGTFAASIYATIAALNAAFLKTPLGRMILIGTLAGFAVDKLEEKAPGVIPYMNAIPDAFMWGGRKIGEHFIGNNEPAPPLYPPGDPRNGLDSNTSYGPNQQGGSDGGGPASVHIIKFENAPPGMKVTSITQNNKDSILKILHSMPTGVAN